jgi:mono/diheme cytochrome c family protein
MPSRARYSYLLSLLTIAATVLVAGGAALAVSGPGSEARTLLQKRCAACHARGHAKGGLRLDTPAQVLQGGDSGPAIKPGDPDGSLLIKLIEGRAGGKRMPPAGPALPQAEIAALRSWIRQWIMPQTHASAKGDTGATSHWSFRPIGRPRVPAIRSPQPAIRNPIDAFILARLQKAGVKPSPEADRRTLIRRLSLDLLGLPPRPEEVEAFINDRRPDAYEQLVDRLLASPHYGERWGRHWLDLARYADSDGYEKDTPRPFAYLYRDWVINALNADMPFDQFTIEQLAGDLLPNATLSQKIATGFHRQTLRNKEGGADQEEDRVKNTVDRTNTTGTVWLGLTVGCAQCHSHKYDPLSHREYYSLYAFFNSAVEEDIPTEVKGQQAMVLGENPKPPVTHIHQRGDFLRLGDPVSPATPVVLPALNSSSNAAPTRLDLARWFVDSRNPLTARVAVNRVWQHLFGRGLVGTPNDWGLRGEKPTHPELLDWLASRFAGSRSQLPGSRVGGDGDRLGSAPGADKYGSASLPNSITPAKSDSPEGLAWRQKALIRLIVTSATYRQASRHRPELRERDPKNLLLARQNRFRPEAEIMRDLALSAGGLLNESVGGPSIRPPLPADIAALGYAGSVKWEETKGPERYKRGMYIFYQRTVPYPLLATFDAPDSNNACTRRERSNTPIQALTLLNDAVFFEAAQSLARRIMIEASTPEGRVRALFRRCLSREPSAAEYARLTQLADEMRRLSEGDPAGATKTAGDQPLPQGASAPKVAAWVLTARAVLNLDEFLTRD